MSISVGKYIDGGNLKDNKLNINSYLFSNVINLNTEDTLSLASHKDAIINFKNKFELGFSNNFFAINNENFNIFKANSNATTIMNNCFFNKDINVKNNLLYTESNTTIINSNLLLKFNHSNDCFKINNFNTNENLFFINKNKIEFNINNSNKFTINDSNININDNVKISSNYSLYTDYIKSITPNKAIEIDNAIIKTFGVENYIIKQSLNINNDRPYDLSSFTIQKYKNPRNTVELFSKEDVIISGISNTIVSKKFTINNNGYIGIGSNNANAPIDISLPITSNESNIFVFKNESNLIDKFYINSRGYIGIGTANTKNQIHIDINDDNRNILNNPAIEMNLYYNSNNNYRTSNIINLNFTAIKNNINVYDDSDAVIGSNIYTSHNFVFDVIPVVNNIPATSSSIAKYTIEITNTINNNYIKEKNISSIINYIQNKSYQSVSITDNNIKYDIIYNLKIPDFLNNNFKLAGVYNNATELLNNPRIEKNNSTYNILYTSYIDIDTSPSYTRNPDDFSKNYLLITNTYKVFELIAGGFNINIVHNLYVQKNAYSILFQDTLTFNYQEPAKLLYATKNNLQTVSLSSDGKLELGDSSESNDYQLYVNNKSRLNNLECFNISSIPGKKNVNFSLCNLSNINKIYSTYSICKFLISETASFTNLNLSNLTIQSNINTNNINVQNLYYNNIIGSNFNLTNNLLSANVKFILGSNYNLPEPNFMTINIDSNYKNGININSFFENYNPSISLIGRANKTYPTYDLINNYSSYSLKLDSNTLGSKEPLILKDVKNNKTIFKHLIYDDNNNNQFIIGNYNNTIFDLSSNDPPTNSTNKISLGYPYKYLQRQASQGISGISPSSWQQHFKDNIVGSDAMLNVYGNINLSTIDNKPFIKCKTDNAPYPNEKINIGIGAEPISEYLLNIDGHVKVNSNIYVSSNVYITSNLYVNRDIFVYGTVGNISDIRVKENIVKIKDSIKKLEQISGYTYTRTDTGRHETGLIAQEVINILPEVINKNNDKNNFYNISYGNMCGLLVEGIKELNDKIKNIENYLLLNTSNFQI
jgi:hypothetical protein